MAVTVDDVRNLSATGWSNLSDGKKTELLNHAERLIDGPLTDTQSRTPTLEGNRDDALTLLAAHFFELAEGGESQSESQSGGSVTYNTVTGEALNSMTETRYGRAVSDFYLRDRQGISIVRSY